MKKYSSHIIVAIVTAAVTTFVVAIIAAFAVHTFKASAARNARKGWNLVPVIVADQDIPQGAVISMGMMAKHLIPEQFVTSSVVKPDSANVIEGQKLLVPVQQGDMLLWSQFETSQPSKPKGRYKYLNECIGILKSIDRPEMIESIEILEGLERAPQ
ncbi:MAG: hypothetical protein LBM75_07520 [Myxococcales bacterium]|jgi:Flp pilus assembly protein CpaB|nr:hypothetical protein [Myxococcales bacterium]